MADEATMYEINKSRIISDFLKTLLSRIVKRIANLQKTKIVFFIFLVDKKREQKFPQRKRKIRFKRTRNSYIEKK